MMKFKRVAATVESLLEPGGSAWKGIEGGDIALVPAPLNGNPMIKRVSPYLEHSTDHGAVTRLTVSGVHNGEALALRLAWLGSGHERLVDLDEFVDGVAAMFPLDAGASAITMGAAGKAVNAWYWKANRKESAFDVVAEGYGTSVRHRDADGSIRAGAACTDGAWQVVLCRALDAGVGRARFRPGQRTALAFAVWDGGNRERAGRKSFSGEFVPADLEA